MGNAMERESWEDCGIEDGEPVYDTLARDIVYRRCSKSEDTKPVSRSASLRNSRNCGAERPIVRKRNSVKRSNSRKSARENRYRISQLKVQTDGKVAVLIPRNSAVKRKRMSTIKAKLNFSKKQTKQNEDATSKNEKQLDSMMSKSLDKDPSKTSAISYPAKKERSENIYTDFVPLRILRRSCHKLSQKVSHSKEDLAIKFPPKGMSGYPNNNSCNENNNNNNNININRAGNMALNVEKARLQKLISAESNNRMTSTKTSNYSQQSEKLAKDLERARLQRFASAESVLELGKRMKTLSVASSVGDTV